MRFASGLALRVVVAAALLSPWLSTPAAAQGSFPGKPVRLILPYPTGGSSDAMARLIAQKLTETWSQSVLVDSKPGGTSSIGTYDLVRSAPDGYTLLLISNDFVINPTLMPNLPFETPKDFAPVGPLSRSDYLMVINPEVPANTLQELVNYAKARPGQLNASSSGTGGTQHLASELFNVLAGVKITHVPYKGIAAAMTDLLANQVQMTFSNPMSLGQHVKAGKVRAIAFSGEKRSPILPNVPTFAEAGMPNFRATNWFGIAMHGKTPPALVAKVSADIHHVQRNTDFPEQLTKQGIESFSLSPAQYLALISEDIERYRQLLKSANIKIQ